MFVMCGALCLELTQGGWQEIDGLQSNQEVADTHLLLHAKHAAERYSAMIYVT